MDRNYVRYTKESFKEALFEFIDKEFTWMLENRSLNVDTNKAITRLLHRIEKSDFKSEEDRILGYFDALKFSDHYWNLVEVDYQDIIMLSLIYKIYNIHMSCMIFISEYNYFDDNIVKEIMFIESDFFDFSIWDEAHVNIVTDLLANFINPIDRYNAIVDLCYNTTPSTDTNFKNVLLRIIDKCNSTSFSKSSHERDLIARYNTRIHSYEREKNEIEVLLNLVNNGIHNVAKSKNLDEVYLPSSFEKIFSDMMRDITSNELSICNFNTCLCSNIIKNAVKAHIEKNCSKEGFMTIPEVFKKQIEIINNKIRRNKELITIEKKSISDDKTKYVLKQRLHWETIWISPFISNEFKIKFKDIHDKNIRMTAIPDSNVTLMDALSYDD